MNIDNYLKILLIIQRYRSRLPVILMGESGCGKTYLLKYVAEIIFKKRVEFFSYILYYGVKEDDFIEFMDNMIKIAKDKPEIDVWIFFDEFNTSELQSIVCELLFDRVFSISKKFYGKT
jgi:MoxR-like ATPase